MGKVSTHILDSSIGKPASNVKIALYRVNDNEATELLKTVQTNADGRTDELLLDESSIAVATYELRFYIGEYFKRTASTVTEPPFLGVVPIRFSVSDASQNYHVPLLVSPWSYSTYRGS